MAIVAAPAPADAQNAARPGVDAAADKAFTILHIGDSHIATDAFTRHVRRVLQRRFGSAGRGVVIPAKSFNFARADGVALTDRGPWRIWNSLTDPQEPPLYSVSGLVLQSEGAGAIATLESETRFDWAEITVARAAGDGPFEVLVDGRRRAAFDAFDGDAPSQLTKRLDAAGRTLSIRALSDAPVRLLDWGVGERGGGLRYLNFGIPDATASLFNNWSRAFLIERLQALSPSIVVFGYGTNEARDPLLPHQKNRADLMALASLVEETLPNTRLVFILPASLALREGRGDAFTASCEPSFSVDYGAYAAQQDDGQVQYPFFHEPPMMALVRENIAAAAADFHGDVWDWREFMGGPCAIHRWALAQPALAHADGIHLKRRGYRRAGEAFAEFLAPIVADQMRRAALAYGRAKAAPAE